MYYYISIRYDASLIVYILSSLGWLIVMAVGYYIFVYKIKRPVSGIKNSRHKHVVSRKIASDRPKVVFKKDQNNN